MNQSIAELYLQAAEEWADLESAAQILEDTKSVVLSQMLLKHGSVAVNKAEILVKASPQWEEHVKRIVEARTAANKAKIRVEYWRMKAMENSSREATERLQARI